MVDPQDGVGNDDTAALVEAGGVLSGGGAVNPALEVACSSASGRGAALRPSCGQLAAAKAAGGS
jgi:hypothetical protein